MRHRTLWGRERAQARFMELNGFYPGVRGFAWSLAERFRGVDCVRSPVLRLFALLIFRLDLLVRGLGLPRSVRRSWGRFLAWRREMGHPPVYTGNQLARRGRT